MLVSQMRPSEDAGMKSRSTLIDEVNSWDVAVRHTRPGKSQYKGRTVELVTGAGSVFAFDVSQLRFRRLPFFLPVSCFTLLFLFVPAFLVEFELEILASLVDLSQLVDERAHFATQLVREVVGRRQVLPHLGHVLSDSSTVRESGRVLLLRLVPFPLHLLVSLLQIVEIALDHPKLARLILVPLLVASQLALHVLESLVVCRAPSAEGRRRIFVLSFQLLHSVPQDGQFVLVLALLLLECLSVLVIPRW